MVHNPIKSNSIEQGTRPPTGSKVTHRSDGCVAKSAFGIVLRFAYAVLGVRGLRLYCLRLGAVA